MWWLIRNICTIVFLGTIFGTIRCMCKCKHWTWVMVDNSLWGGGRWDVCNGQSTKKTGIIELHSRRRHYAIVVVIDIVVAIVVVRFEYLHHYCWASDERGGSRSTPKCILFPVLLILATCTSTNSWGGWFRGGVGQVTASIVRERDRAEPSHQSASPHYWYL